MPRALAGLYKARARAPPGAEHVRGRAAWNRACSALDVNPSRRASPLGRAWQLARGTLRRFRDDEAMRLSAALAFYSIFSLAPLLVIVVAIAGTAFGDEAVSGRLAAQLRSVMGEQSAETLQSMVESARRPTDNLLAMAVGIATLLFGASGVFTQIREALNRVWDVDRDPPRGWRHAVLGRFLSLAMVLCIGFLLLVSLVISTLIDVLAERFSTRLPLPAPALQALHFGFSFGVIVLLFALIFRFLSDVRVPWPAAWRGAAVTTVLFLVGQQLLGLYLAHQTAKSAYGAAGSVIVILTWVYFSAVTLLLGAEYIQVHADERSPAERARLRAPAKQARPAGVRP